MTEEQRKLHPQRWSEIPGIPVTFQKRALLKDNPKNKTAAPVVASHTFYTQTSG
jgi:hypothetical protein